MTACAEDATPRSHARAYDVDPTVRRFDATVLGGSPLTLFRLTPAGRALFERIETGAPVPRSRLIDRLVRAGVVHPRPHADAPHTAADVTVVMPCLGRPGSIPDGAVVVDDGSVPPIAGAAARLPVTCGPAAARNAGLALVRTPLVAFVDADVTVPDGWIDGLLTHFADPDVVLVAPRVRSRPGAGTVAAFERDHSPLDLGPLPARIRSGSRVAYVPAAAMICRTDAIRSIGGFDEGLRFGEDVDLCWRLDAVGGVLRYEPAVVVEHAPRRSWPELVRQRVGYGSSAAPLARRHPGALAPLRMSGWSVATWVLGLAGHPVLGAAIGAGSATALVRKLPDVPPRVAFELGATGNARAGEQIAEAIRRAWWPILGVAALRSRTARRALVAATLAARRPGTLVDDVAYSIGVWRGVLVERTLGPLRPAITSWPGRAARRRSGPDGPTQPGGGPDPVPSAA